MGKFSLSLEEIEKQISLVDGSKTQAALDYRKNNPKLTVLNPVQNSTNIKAELPALNKVQPSAPLAQPTTKEDKIDKWLNPSYKMSKEEKKEAKELTDAFMSEVHNRKFDGSDEEYKRMTDLYNKSHTGAAVMSGFIDALPFYKYAMDGVSKLAGTDESFSDFMDRTTQNAQAQNKGAYWAGNIGTNLGEYAVGTKLLEGLGLLGEGGKITQGVSKVIKNQKLANGTANVLGDMTLDVALDTVPTTIDNVRSGMDAGEVAKEAGKNIGLNLAFNVGGETVAKPLVNKIFGGKTVKNTKLPKLGDDVVEEVETITKQSDEPAKALEQSAKPDAVEIANKKMIEDAQKDGFAPTLYKKGTGINAYEPKRIEQLSSSKGKVNGKDSFADFIKESKVKKNGNQEPIRYYFGTVSDELADDIFVNTGIDLEGYNIAVRDDEIRHFFNNHGNAKNEALRGQIGVTDAMVEKLPSVFNKPDSIKISTDKDYGGRVVIQIEKRIDGHVVTLNGISKGKHNLEIDTIRIYPTDTKKISTAHTVNGNSPIPKTPETSMGEGYSSAFSISNSQNNVNDVTAEAVKKFNIKDYPDATDAYKSAKNNIHNMFNMFGSKEQEQTVMNAVNDFVENPSIEKYVELKTMVEKEADSLIGTEYHYRGDKAKKIGKTRKFDKEYDYMSVSDSMDELYNSVRDRAKLNANKVMAEDIGITPTAESIEIPAEGYRKVSKARTNTLEKSGINTPDELANKYLDESNFTYVDTTEKVSMGKARERVATDGVDFWKDKLMAQEDFASEDVDTMMLVYTDKVRQARETGNEELWKEAGTVFKKIQEVGSKMGAGVQAFAKWGRQTPEGVVADTFRNVKEKITKQLGEKRAVEIVDQLTEELQKEIYELAETAFNEGLDSQVGKEALAKIGRVVNKNTPKSLKGIVKSYLMDSMLLNFRTLITRNAGGNLGYNAMEFARQPITAGIDTAVSKLTGQRTRTGWKTDKIASAFSGLAKGISDEARDMQKGIHTLKSGQNTISDAIYSNSNPFKGNNVITKALNKIDDLTKHGLSVGDRPFYEAAYKQRLSELNDLRARGLLGEEVMKLSDDDFNVMAEMSAKLDGLTATYQDDAAMAKALEGLKSAVGKFSEGFAGTDVLSQFVMPFTRTPGNIITRSLEYSPYGLVKNTVNTVGELRKGNFNQQRFVDEAGRNILGTGLFAGGIAAYDNGLITGGYSDDKDMANAQKQAGMQEYALRTNIGGKEGNFDISWLPVLGNDLVAAAAFKEAYDADVENPLSAGVQGALTGANTLLNTSTLQGMNRMFGGNTSYSSEQNLLANAKDALTSGFGQAIPSLLRQGVQTADEYQRNISNGDREYWQNNLMASLPVLREELQPKIDNEGNVMLNNQGRDLGSRIVENMIIPGKYTELQDSVVNDEAMRLFESTGSNIAFLPTPNRKDLTSKNGYEATDERFYKYQVELGSKNAETARAVIESDFYRGLSDEQKAEVLSDVYSAMKAVVKEKMVVGYSSDNKLASVYKSDGVRGVVNYLSGKQLANSYGIDSNYDSSLEFIDTYGADAYKDAGDAISSLGLKQSKANRELYVSGGLQALEIASYADADGNGEITKTNELIPYLKMQNWTAEEKNRVVEQFGFSTKGIKW